MVSWIQWDVNGNMHGLSAHNRFERPKTPDLMDGMPQGHELQPGGNLIL
jgi:hypothetical protein